MRVLLADADIGQVVFVLVALAVAFINWVVKLIKEKAETAERARRMPTPEETAARRRAWEEQTRSAVPSPTSQPQEPPSRGGTLEDLLGELRKAMEPHREAPKPPPMPPPMPQPARPAREKPLPLAPPSPSPTPEIVPGSVAALPSLRTRRRPHPLTRVLREVDGYRQAFVLREVLGPPRAFEEYSGPD